MWRTQRLIGTALVCSTALAASARAQTPSVLMWYREPAPTLPAGAYLAPWTGNDQWISAEGSTVLRATLANPGGSGWAVCRMTPQGPVVLARAGEPAPGAEPYVFGGQPNTPTVLAAGDSGALIRTTLTTPGQFDAQAWYVFDGELRPCIRQRGPAPGRPGDTVVGVQSAVSNGHTTLVGATTTGGSGLWATTPDGTSPLVHSGDQAPGMPPGRTFTTFYSEGAAINRSGVVAFDATVGPAPLAEGIWMGPPGALSLVVQTGDPAPGVPGGQFRWVFSPTLNDVGGVAFLAGLDPGAPSPRLSLWLSHNGSLAPIAVQGEPAPGTDAFFADIAVQPFGVQPSFLLTDAGVVVFYAALTGPGVSPANNTGIWAGTPGQVRLLARKGDRAPGLPPGSLYLGMPSSGLTAGGPAADGQGNIVFTADVSGVGPVVMLSDHRGRTDVLLRTGMMIPTAPNFLERLDRFTFPLEVGSGLSGRPAVLSQAGGLLMHLRTFSTFNLTRDALGVLRLGPRCPANCDRSTAPPVLNVNDFTCFLNRFAEGDPWANCDGSTTTPVLNVGDFICFLNEFAAGCQ